MHRTAIGLAFLISAGPVLSFGEEQPTRWRGWCEYQALQGERFPPARLNLPEWACNAAFEAKLHSRYAVYSRINPFFLTADFDGDGKLDIAIWVMDRRSKKVGIAILRRDSKEPVVLGAGKAWEERGENFVALDMWSVIPKGEVLESNYEDNKKTQLTGDALMLMKSDSAAFAVYWDGSKYRSYQLSD
jgi:hypothetical protein